MKAKQNKAVFKVSQQVESNRLRTQLLLVMLPLGGFPGGKPRRRFWAQLAHISPEMRFTSERKRSAAEKKEKSFFSTFFSSPLPTLRRSPRASAKTASETRIELLSECKRKQVQTHAFFFFAHAVPANAHVLIPTAPKGVLTICTRREAEEEGKEEES